MFSFVLSTSSLGPPEGSMKLNTSYVNVTDLNAQFDFLRSSFWALSKFKLIPQMWATFIRDYVINM